MSRCLKTFLLLLQIGGGLLGIVLVGRSFLTDDLTQVAVIIHAAFILVFSFGILAGATLIKKPKLGLVLSLLYQGIQIPIIISSVFSYNLFSGATFSLYLHSTGFRWDLLFGSRYYFFINSGEPWCAGINAIALVLFILLIREIRLETAVVKVSEPEVPDVPRRVDWRTS